MWVDSAVAEQLRILKEQYFYAWVVGGKGWPICRQLGSKHACDRNAGENIGKAYEGKTIKHRLLVGPHASKPGSVT